ncbi:glycoside hydrolase family 13 protein [Tuber magnatum]|uniref:Alpha-amylase n=1 Tax=Tuber magnatum TaxID=42249 RepID=A0A317SIX6_9PEZI|nr:glycoside hydrolase family 13 protein [Tuber magnatum]
MVYTGQVPFLAGLWTYIESARFLSFPRLASPLQGRAAQVSLSSWTFADNVLSGSIRIQNLAYHKVVTVFYAVGSTWSESQKISAAWSAQGSDGYETWTFSGVATGATQFHINYYAPGNNANYELLTTTTGTATPTTTTTALTSVTSSTTTTPTTPIATTPLSIGSVNPSAPPAIIPSNIPSEPIPTVPSGCRNWNGLDGCARRVYTFPDSAERRRWQTPPEGEGGYVSTFQDYRDLVGYADIQYSSDRTRAVVVVNAASRTGKSLTYSFNGATQSVNTFQVDSGLAGQLAITITGSDGSALVLEPLNFIWQNAPLTAARSNFSDGQKGGIVELFGWPYDDIAKECAFLGKAGWMGVKIWPATEHVWGSHYFESDNQFRPWYLVYQPVSYRLHSRMGTRVQLRAMIQACRTEGVRVYADAVINHMVAQGTDIQNHRVSSCGSYSGHNSTDGSPYFTSGNTYLLNPYTGTRPTLEFPSVPYGPTDFHCERILNSWNDGQIITKGWLLGLTDLNTEKPYVQDRIATYLVDLLSIGFTGFRVDAAKHIGPASLAQILGRVKTKMGGNTPADWITWLEVIMGGESRLLACSGGEWSWYTNLDNQLKAAGLSHVDIAKVKVWSSDYPKEMPICGRWVIPASRFAIQNDDHDQQSPGSSSRDMADKGSVLIKDKDAAKHRGFEIQLFSRTDANWRIKLVLSSYSFMGDGASGFPDGHSDCSLYTGNQAISRCLGVPRDTAYVADACSYTISPGKYTRVHRDLPIINAMRAWVGLASTTAAALGISGC